MSYKSKISFKSPCESSDNPMDQRILISQVTKDGFEKKGRHVLPHQAAQIS